MTATRKVHIATPQVNYPAAELVLVQLLCAPQAIRAAHTELASATLARCDPERLLALLRRLNLVSLIGRRILEIDPDPGPELSQVVTEVTEIIRRRGELQDFVGASALAMLRREGVRGLAVKGTALTRALYGDLGLRSSEDIDLLVARPDLPTAVATIERMGWRREIPVGGGTPVLHEVLTHPELPVIELHWRLHWYEAEFSRRALERAEPDPIVGGLRMHAADELLSLLLFYERDGFSGLRLPADIVTWCDRYGPGPDLGSALEGLLTEHPSLRAPVRESARILSGLVGLVPIVTGVETWRGRLARALTNPYLNGDVPQIRADASLVDLLLAPPGGVRASLGRQLARTPESPQRAVNGRSPWTRRAGHGTRMLGRWAIGLGHAVRAARRGRRTALTWA